MQYSFFLIPIIILRIIILNVVLIYKLFFFFNTKKDFQNVVLWTLYTEFMFILMANSLYNHPVILYYIKINAIERDLSASVLTPIVKYVTAPPTEYIIYNNKLTRISIISL